MPDTEFTPEERRAIIRTSIPYEVWETMSGVTILEMLQSFGLGIARADFYEIMREVRAVGRYYAEYAALEPDALVPRRWMSTVHGWELTEPYLYRFRINGVLPGTRTEVVKYLSLYGDEQLSRAEAEAAIMEYVQDDPDLYGIEASTANLIHVYAAT